MAVMDYLAEIAALREVFQQKLTEKSVDITGCTTYNQLIEKVGEISVSQKTGLQNGVWTPTVTTDSFSLTGLDFVPAKLAICCSDVLTHTYSSPQQNINIGLLNIELSGTEVNMLRSGEAGVTVEAGDTTAEISVEAANGLYAVTVSFSECNQTRQQKYRFKANASHIWCIAEEGWLI